MNFKYIILFLAICVFLFPGICAASSNDTTCILIVNPTAAIICDINKRAPVDVQIVAYSRKLPKTLYDAFASSGQIQLYTRFDEMLRLAEQCTEDSKLGFIGCIGDSIKYIPDGYLFASIDKESDKIVIRAEILNANGKSLAVANCRIRFARFLKDDIVFQEIKNLAKKLQKVFCPDFDNESSFISVQISVSNLFGGDRMTLANIPQSIRVIPPHPDDVLIRPDDIADTNVFDNYFIGENIVNLETSNQTAVTLEFCFWEVLNIGINSSRVESSGLVLNKSLYRKTYIEANPDDPYAGSALIFYGIEVRERELFSEASYSIPISLSYPIWNIGPHKNLTIKATIGTNLLLPPALRLRSRQGWDRFGEMQDQRVTDIGEVKTVHYFLGLSAVQAIGSWGGGIGIQASLYYIDYREQLKNGIDFEINSSLHPALKVFWSLDLPW